MIRRPPRSTLFPTRRSSDLFWASLRWFALQGVSSIQQCAMPTSGRARSSSVKPTARKYEDRKSTRLNSSHLVISYAVFCLKKKKTRIHSQETEQYGQR